MAAAIAQTIAVVDKSGKVVSTSKQLKNVFMEAKFAYRERKAEIVADRRAKAAAKQGSDPRRVVTDLRIENTHSGHSRVSSRRHSHSHSHRHHESERHPRPDALGRHYSGSSIRSRREKHGDTSPRSTASSSHYHAPRAESDTSRPSRSAPTSPVLTNGPKRRSVDLVRRRTDMDLYRPSQARQEAPVRSLSTTAIDMDLAYGDYHPSSIAPILHATEEKELLTLVERARMLLDEANCAQHSVRAMVEHLQKNPDAMAAVALTLAEISNIASKMAPGVLTAFKGSAPAVFALLASPQFLIAAGVGIGVTVVMFGGYKIIKKIKAKNAAGKEESMDEMIEIDGEEISRINAWRRGIVMPADGTDGETASVGTSVEGEFITPLAASMRGMETREDLLAGLSERQRKKREKKESKKENKERKQKRKLLLESRTDITGEKTLPSGTSSKSSITDDPRKASLKVKKPSPLRRLLA